MTPTDTWLQHSVRDADMAARYGGEEFMLIMPETDGEAAGILAERLRADVAATQTSTAGGTLSVTISIGVVSYIPDTEKISPDRLIQTADDAMYDSKQGGRNRVTSTTLQ